jgi:hypothetical protein
MNEQELIPTKLVKTSVSANRGRIEGEFLRGPIPLSWLSVAAKIGDTAALQVALALWWERGRRNALEIRLTTALLSRFMDVKDRRKKTRGIKALEDAGLISVVREPRKNPMITLILEVTR